MGVEKMEVEGPGSDEDPGSFEEEDDRDSQYGSD